MTLPPWPGKLNERFRDRIDLLVKEELVTDYAALREACDSSLRRLGPGGDELP